ncbi:hypothetical protein ACPPVQ_05905 [Diaminobutyricibacter sp. McL0618]|uniref:hypothetical protein n=1 Tax=Leifsonia sp. McL0618 TaxID=3415677 RepID=UPI003CF1BC95
MKIYMIGDLTADTDGPEDFDYRISDKIHPDGFIHIPFECSGALGYTLPVRFTPGTFDDAVRWDHASGWPTAGRAWDALFMALAAAKRAADTPYMRQPFIFKRVPNRRPSDGYRPRS